MKYFAVLLLLIVAISAVPLESNKKPKGRIFNGSTAASAQFPYQVYIMATKQNNVGRYVDYECSGAILSKHWIITAAFCVFEAKNVRIQAGSTTIYTSDPHRVTIMADKFYVPDGFDWDTPYEKEIGLIKLKTPLEYNEYIQSIALTTEDVQSDTIVTVSGWGSITQLSEKLTNYLQYAPFKILSEAECRKAYPDESDDIFCANSTTSRIKHICPGDQGTPLVKDESTKPVLIGIGAFWSGSGCGVKAYASGFTKVYNYRKWIQEITGITL